MAEQSDFMTMQQDAMRRVREMQQRSRSFVEPPEENGTNDTPSAQQSASSASDRSAAISDVSVKKSKPLFSLAGIDIDEEKALIALMIYILYKNQADMKLLLGLGYLLL